MKIIYFLFLVISCLGFGQKSWKLVKNENGVQIWTRDFENTKLKEYKAVTYIQTSVQDVVNELLDAPRYDKNYKEGISHLIKADDENYFFYVHNEFPWPIKDRDVVSRLKVQKISENKVKLDIKAAPNEIPESGNMLRIREMSGYWLLERVGDEVRVIQQLHIDPEGSLPSFITNSLLVSGPFKTFKVLKNKLEKQDSES